MDEFLLELQAKLDEAKSKGLINADIEKIQQQVDKLKLQVEIDPKSISNLVKQLESVLNQKITISNIGINQQQAIKSGQQTGEQIGNAINQSINKVIQKGNFKKVFVPTDNFNNAAKDAENYFKTLSSTVSVQEQLGKNNNLEAFTVSLKNAEGVVEQLRYKYRELADDTGNVTDRWFEYSGGSINDNGVIKQMNAISAKADSLQTKLEKLKSSYSDINSSRPIKDSNNISALSQQYDKVSQAIKNVRSADNSTFSSMVSNAQKEITVLESMVSQFRNAENVATQMKSVDISSGIAQAQERLGKLKANSSGFEQMTQTLKELDVAIESVGDKSSLDAFIDKLRVAEAQLSRVKAEVKSTAQVDKIQLSLDTGDYESKVQNLIARTQQWTDENGNARISTYNLSQALADLNTAQNNLAKNNTVENQQALINAEKNLSTQIKTVTSDIRSMNAEFMKSSAVDSLRQKVQQFYDINGKSHRTFGADLKRIMSELGSGMEVPIAKGKQLEQEFIKIQNEARQTGKLGKTFFQTIKEGMSSFSYWTSSTFLVMKAINETRQAISTVTVLDTAYVDLRKTANMTVQELEDFYYTSNDVAKQMGVTTQEIIEQASAWSRLGFSTAEAATKMAQLSSKFASISPGMTTDQAQSGLVSIIKAWGLDVSEVEREVLDNINTLGNKFAESNLDIITGMQRSAAALAATGTTYQEAFALFTGAQEVLQNAEVGGRALRSISMRIHGYSEDSEDGLQVVDEELKNITGDLINLTKTAEHSQGVSIFKEGSNTEFKSLVEYFGEINEIWDEMSQKQQNDFLDKAFGKNQAQAGAAIIQNYEAITDAIDAMENAAGSAEREMSVIMDSIDYKLNTTAETATGIAQNLFQREDMKNVLDVLNSFMGLLDKATEKLGLFRTVAVGSGLFAGFKNVGVA